MIIRPYILAPFYLHRRRNKPATLYIFIGYIDTRRLLLSLPATYAGRQWIPLYNNYGSAAHQVPMAQVSA